MKQKKTIMVSLNVSANAKLSLLDCNVSGLYSLDVSRNPALETLICFKNQIEELDLSRNSLLTTFDGWGNRLITLDVTQNEQLAYLDCSVNYMNSIADVIGWENKGLILDETFIFYPQKEISEG